LKDSSSCRPFSGSCAGSAGFGWWFYHGETPGVDRVKKEADVATVLGFAVWRCNNSWFGAMVKAWCRRRKNQATAAPEEWAEAEGPARSGAEAKGPAAADQHCRPGFQRRAEVTGGTVLHPEPTLSPHP